MAQQELTESARINSLPTMCASGNPAACDKKATLDAAGVANLNEAKDKVEALCSTSQNPYACQWINVNRIMSGDGEGDDLAIQCDIESSYLACKKINQLKRDCLKKDAVACLWMASVAKYRSDDASDGVRLYRSFKSKACQYGEKNACKELREIDKDEKQALAQKVAEPAPLPLCREITKLKIGMTKRRVAKILGEPTYSHMQTCGGLGKIKPWSCEELTYSCRPDASGTFNSTISVWYSGDNVNHWQ